MADREREVSSRPYKVRLAVFPSATWTRRGEVNPAGPHAEIMLECSLRERTTDDESIAVTRPAIVRESLALGCVEELGQTR